jgi:flagellar biosynthesis activator protein FlaF
VTPSNLARSAYGRPDAPARSPRTVEYDLFARVTRALASAQAATGPAGRADFATLAKALHDNGRMWRVLATDVAGPGNALPAALRARLFYLYQFTEVHSRKVLDGTAEAGVLVDINTAVMRGLRGEGVAA